MGDCIRKEPRNFPYKFNHGKYVIMDRLFALRSFWTQNFILSYWVKIQTFCISILLWYQTYRNVEMLTNTFPMFSQYTKWYGFINENSNFVLIFQFNLNVNLFFLYYPGICHISKPKGLSNLTFSKLSYNSPFAIT